MAKTKAPAEGKLQVKVFSPYQTFFEGTATSLSGANATGPFDVLLNHTNFFSMLSPGLIRVDTGFEAVEIEVQGGFIKVTANRVTVFANI